MNRYDPYNHVGKFAFKKAKPIASWPKDFRGFSWLPIKLPVVPSKGTEG
jgi:hypothetical protein